MPLQADIVYVRADVDFRDAVDTASFAYSYDGSNWAGLGDTPQVQYDLAHFTGYRFALLNCATAEPGGYVDVDCVDPRAHLAEAIRAHRGDDRRRRQRRAAASGTSAMSASERMHRPDGGAGESPTSASAQTR